MPIKDDVSILAGRARSIPDPLLARARELRHAQTHAENLLWERLRDRRLHGAKFRRQHNVGQFIADFYCHQARLIVEADGGIHEQQLERDSMRDEWAQTNGFRVVRITNDEIADDIEAVLRRIAEALTP
jgi:very-short-patch-repair endonuclease